MSRYVIVSTDQADKVIKEGPILWDGVSSFDLAPSRQAITETAATAAGYTFAPQPVAQVNAGVLQQRAMTALGNNAAYLAIGAPTAAQAIPQVAALTRQMNGVIRLLLAQTNDISNA